METIPKAGDRRGLIETWALPSRRHRLPHVPLTHRTATSPARTSAASTRRAACALRRWSSRIRADAAPILCHSLRRVTTAEGKDVPRNTQLESWTRRSPPMISAPAVKSSESAAGPRTDSVACSPAPARSWYVLFPKSRGAPAPGLVPSSRAVLRLRRAQVPTNATAHSLTAGAVWWEMGWESGGYEGAPGPAPMPTTHFRGTPCEGIPVSLLHCVLFPSLPFPSRPRLAFLSFRTAGLFLRFVLSSMRRAECPRSHPRSSFCRECPALIPLAAPLGRTRVHGRILPDAGERVPRPVRVSPEHVRRARVVQVQRAQPLDAAHGLDARLPRARPRGALHLVRGAGQVSRDRPRPRIDSHGRRRRAQTSLESRGRGVHAPDATTPRALASCMPRHGAPARGDGQRASASAWLLSRATRARGFKILFVSK
ncbi:hypothetical protein C8J57DRAFT_1534382 [Mycena rebaudengoi]|nr:hypothetical protein C8J57DRAFT_1534382 [Mycena rebaudengoi]